MGFSDFFKSKKSTVTQEPLIPDFQLETGKNLSALINRYLQQYQPGQEYTGDFVAGLSDAEKTGQSQLADLLASPDTGELYDASKRNVLDTLGGRYADPSQSPFIRSMINLSKMNLQDEIDTSRRSAGARGTYFSKSAIQDEGRLRERTQNNLNSLVGQYIDNERNRQTNAVQQALNLEKYGTLDVPLSKIDAASTYGSLPRVVQQAQLEAQYQDFVRQQNEFGGVSGAAQGLYSTNVPYGVKSITTKKPSAFMSIAGEVSPFIGSYNTHQYGYDVNQSSVSDALKALAKIIG